MRFRVLSILLSCLNLQVNDCSAAPMVADDGETGPSTRANTPAPAKRLPSPTRPMLVLPINLPPEAPVSPAAVIEKQRPLRASTACFLGDLKVAPVGKTHNAGSLIALKLWAHYVYSKLIETKQLSEFKGSSHSYRVWLKPNGKITNPTAVTETGCRAHDERIAQIIDEAAVEAFEPWMADQLRGDNEFMVDIKPSGALKVSVRDGDTMLALCPPD